LGLTQYNASLAGYFGLGFSESWHVLAEILETPPSSLKSVIDIDCLREHAMGLRRDGVERHALLATFSLACWLSVRGSTK